MWILSLQRSVLEEVIISLRELSYTLRDSFFYMEKNTLHTVQALTLDLHHEVQGVDLLHAFSELDQKYIFEFARDTLNNPNITPFYKRLIMDVFFLLQEKFGPYKKVPFDSKEFDDKSRFFRDELLYLLSKKTSMALDSMID